MNEPFDIAGHYERLLERLKGRDQLLDFMVHSAADRQYFAKQFTPATFSRPFSENHKYLFDQFTNKTQTCATAAPRSVGKSSIAEANTLHGVLDFSEYFYICYVGASLKEAVKHTEAIKSEIEENPLILQLWGDLKSDNWAQERWITKNGKCVEALGADQKKLGTRYRQHRPDLLILDDIEDEELVKNENNRAYLKEWLFGKILPMIDLANPRAKIVLLGTIKHEDSLLENLLKDENWNGVRLELCDGSFKSLWPEYLDDAGVKRLYDRFKRQGMIRKFHQEYRNRPMPDEEREFRTEYFHHYKESEANLGKDRMLDNLVIVDPGKTQKRRSKETAILGIGINRVKQLIYVREVDNGKFNPEETIEKALAMCDRLNTFMLFFEETSLHQWATTPIQNEILRRNLPIQLHTISAPKNEDSKENRIRQMIPLYRKGQFLHNEFCCGELEAQLLSFPRSTLWDVMDALSYVLQIMDDCHKYFIHSGTDSDVEAEEEGLYEELAADDQQEAQLEFVRTF